LTPVPAAPILGSATDRDFFELAPVALCLSDAGGRILAVNRRFAEELGYALEDLPTVESWFRAAYPDPAYRAETAAAWSAAVAGASGTGGFVEPGEFRVRRKDGRDRVFQISASVSGGRILSSFIDVSDRVRARGEALQELLASGRLFLGDFGEAVRAVTEACSRYVGAGRVSVWRYSADYGEIECVDFYDRASGRHRSGERLPTAGFPEYVSRHRRGLSVVAREVRGDPVASALPSGYLSAKDIRSLLDAPVWMGEAVRGILSFEAVGESRDWTAEDERLAETMATVLSLGFEIAERKRAESGLAGREAALRAVLEAAPYPIVIQRGGPGVILAANRAYLESVGADRLEDILGKPVSEVSRAVDPRETAAMQAEIARSGKIDGMPYRSRRADGSVASSIVSVRRLEFEGGSAYVSAVVDVTELARARDELEALNAELERKVAARTDELVRANEGLAAANEGLARAMEELKAAQAQALASEKLAALGRISAGLAHELNTPLAAIAAAARTVRASLGPGFEELAASVSRLGPEGLALLGEARGLGDEESPEVDPQAERRAKRAARAELSAAGLADEEAEALGDELVELGLGRAVPRLSPFLAGPGGEALLAALRAVVGGRRAGRVAEVSVEQAARVLSALRAYVRGGPGESPRPVGLAGAVGAMAELFKARARRGVRLRFDFAACEAVLGRPEELDRIWFNLLSNALHAVGDEGSVEVSSAIEGGLAVVSFADSGPGIPEGLRGRIFEPFFSTKAPGEGTGLGLDIARRLARANGGDISFESRPGRTVFRVRLPVARNYGPEASAR